MKKCLLVLLAAGMVLFAAFPAAAEEAAADSDPGLMNLFNEWETNGYPDDVGGVYYNSDTGKMTVSLVGGSEARRDEIRAMVTDPDAVDFDNATYSYNELLRVMEEIQKEMSENGIHSAGIGWRSAAGKPAGFGESGKEFRVVVTVNESVYDEYVKSCRSRFGDRVFVESGPAAQPTAEDSALQLPLSEQNPAGTPGGSLLLPAVLSALLLCGAGAAFAFRRRLIPVRQAAGNTAAQTRSITAGRRDVVDAVKEHEVSPDDRIFDDIMRKIDS